MKELTKAEEQVMQYLWKLKKGFLKEIVEQFPEPKPASTTIATVIRVLVSKGFIAYRSYGKVNEYYPLIEKLQYSDFQFNTLLSAYFNNSPSRFASFFAGSEKISITELEEIRKMIDDKIQTKRKQ